MPRLAIGDIALHVEERGFGAPVVLLHGFTGSGRQWAPHAESLGRSFRTITIDLLGHGKSDAPPGPARYRMSRCVADLAAVVDQLGIERASWLGYSMGGRVALAFAIAHPTRVERLILEGASPGIDDLTERRARIASDEALAQQIERDGVERFVDAWMRQPLFASQVRVGAAALTAARAARCGNSAVGLATSLRGMGTGAQESLWHRLPEVTAPTLLIAGEEDDKFRAIAAAMATHLRRAQLAVIPRAGHTTHFENPTAFERRVLAFLKEDV